MNDLLRLFSFSLEHVHRLLSPDENAACRRQPSPCHGGERTGTGSARGGGPPLSDDPAQGTLIFIPTFDGRPPPPSANTRLAPSAQFRGTGSWTRAPILRGVAVYW